MLEPLLITCPPLNKVLGRGDFEFPTRAEPTSIELVVRVGQLGVGRREEVDYLLIREEVRAVAKPKVSLWGNSSRRGQSQRSRARSRSMPTIVLSCSPKQFFPADGKHGEFSTSRPLRLHRSRRQLHTFLVLALLSSVWGIRAVQYFKYKSENKEEPPQDSLNWTCIM